MKIRQARIEDLAAIVAIERENFSLEEAMSQEVLEAHLKHCKTSFLVAEEGNELLGYLEGPVQRERHLKDLSFTVSVIDTSEQVGGYISITSLSISPTSQGSGIGKALINAMKAVATRDGRLGINLTCHDYLIAYYERHGFINEGVSSSQYAEEVWYDLVWETVSP
ncbi:GNAT family N-acetyltransferase [Streptococcus himalayensis]|uniref:N-acetyltransferase n=1 Tax=Streptococcus himalayensis TaxID=1888195 RepID=A0A917EG78_9STRE|nr:N-acetyltransferase [Streptococcus himalayensis]GGE30047.1 N-acetyltransferase [Streptococcus himalayensis]